MSMKKLLVFGLTSFAVIGIATLANAADLAVGPTYKAPPPVAAPVATWAGLYIGGHIGAGWGDKTLMCAEGCAPLPTGFVDANGTVSGILGGGQIGYNLQLMPQWVAGIEADVSAADVKGNYSCFGVFDQHFGFADQCSSRSNVLGTVVGRVGPTVGQAWIYLLGGAAWTYDHHTNNSVELTTFTVFNYRAEETRWGYTIGAGIEYAFTPNWSAKIQYNFMDFGTHTVSFVDQFSSTVLGQPPSFAEDIKQRIHTVTFGVNYRFSWL